MPLSGVARFQRFFRAASGLDVDKDDLKHYVEFVNQTVYDLLLVAHATATVNGRDVVEPFDLPVTKGLQENIHRFEQMDEELDLEPLLQDMVKWRPVDAVCGEETEARLPIVAGGLSVALARVFRVIDSDVVNPSSVHWERAFRTFDLLL